MQDLIYKSGQAGINKAVVSIIFDNTNPAQSPQGFENVKEITVSRQIALGGKNKFLINGVNVTGKKIQDFFCSVQLNVNNPHFLIMQGRITKVLNMKPFEVREFVELILLHYSLIMSKVIIFCQILSMVDEAAGTRMYHVKKQETQKLIEKKDAKLAEFQAVSEYLFQITSHNNIHPYWHFQIGSRLLWQFKICWVAYYTCRGLWLFLGGFSSI